MYYNYMYSNNFTEYAMCDKHPNPTACTYLYVIFEPDSFCYKLAVTYG